jgi:hypothetical protein
MTCRVFFLLLIALVFLKDPESYLIEGPMYVFYVTHGLSIPILGKFPAELMSSTSFASHQKVPDVRPARDW